MYTAPSRQQISDAIDQAVTGITPEQRATLSRAIHIQCSHPPEGLPTSDHACMQTIEQYAKRLQDSEPATSVVHEVIRDWPMPHISAKLVQWLVHAAYNQGFREGAAKERVEG